MKNTLNTVKNIQKKHQTETKLGDDWNAVVDVIHPVATVPVGFECPLAAFNGSPALRGTSINQIREIPLNPWTSFGRIIF